MKRVAIINSDPNYDKLFLDLGYAIADTWHTADFICFTGGSDVSPSYYGHSKHATTFSNIQRDEKESAIFREALAITIPMCGICRGGQLLNVLSGGTMYQDVSNHCQSHSIMDIDTGEMIWATSTHHQMMSPSDDATIVAIAGLSGYREYWDGRKFVRETSEEDVEAVYYAHTRSLCFQPHPEFYGISYKELKVYFGELLTKYLGV